MTPSRFRLIIIPAVGVALLMAGCGSSGVQVTAAPASTPKAVSFSEAQLLQVARATYHGGDHYVAAPGDCGYLAVGTPETAQFDACPFTAAFRARFVAPVKIVVAFARPLPGRGYIFLCGCLNPLGNLTYAATSTATGGRATVTTAFYTPRTTYTLTIVSVNGQPLVDGITMSHPADDSTGYAACSTDLIVLLCA